jgi:FG-GAP repeat protein
LRFSILILFLLFTPIFSQQLYEKQIYPFDGIKNDYFGFALSISDSFLFTSSIRYENTIDAAVYSYKYENNDYKFLNKIRPTIPEAGALFSTRILYQDNQLLVGAQNKKLNGLTVGALYVFELEDSVWIEKQVIYPPEPRTFGGLFSNVIVKYKNYLLVSAYRADAGEEDAGKVFLYEYINDNFELLREFVPHDPKEFQFFGTSLLMDDNLIVIGSQNDSTESGEGSGSIYVYEKTNVAWTFKSKYIPNQNSELLAYGCDLAMNDEYIIVGTTDNFNYNKPGQAYIYKYTGPKLELVQIITT